MRCDPQFEFIRVAMVAVFESVLEIIFSKETAMKRVSCHIWAPITVSGRLCLVEHAERPHQCLMENELTLLKAVTDTLVKMDPESCNFQINANFSSYGFWQPSPQREELKACLVLSLAENFDLANFLVVFCSHLLGRLESFREEIKIDGKLAVNVLGDMIHKQSGLG